LLDTYDAERRPAAAAVLAATDRNTQVFFATSPLAKWLRNRVFMPLLGTGPVQRRLVARLSQLDMNYRDSMLSRQVGRRRLRAGDRAPDVVLQRKEGSIRLFELLATTRFIALLTRPDPELERALTGLGLTVHVVAAEGDFRKLYGASDGDIWLIRPDGYVGLICPSSQRDVIAEYLGQLWSAADVARAFGRRAEGRRRFTPHVLAQVGISVQFLALVRTLAEYFRLRPALTIETATPFVGGALLTALLGWVAVLCYFAGKERAATGVAVSTVLALVVFKMVAF